MQLKQTETFLENTLDTSTLSETGIHRLRNPALPLIVSIEAELIKGARKYLDGNNFTEVVVPHITKATGACENIATMFPLDYFGERSYLTQTGQLYLESLIPGLGNVFCIGPSFRAEPDVDNRHLTEFTLMEFELPCNFEELLVHIENTICSMMQSVLNNKKDELELLGIGTGHIENAKLPFRRITYTNAIKLLNDLGIGIRWGDDLKSLHEKIIVSHLGDRPTFITHYPEEIKFFNMRRNTEDASIVNSADLILPFSGEAVGSAEREHNHDALHERLSKSKMLKMLEERGGSIEDFRWYLDFIEEFPLQHSGCGIGLNRVTQFVLASSDIRMTTGYPMNRVSLL